MAKNKPGQTTGLAAIEEALAKMLKGINAADVPLEDKLSILDRAIKVEALKAKMDDGDDGSAFNAPPEED